MKLLEVACFSLPDAIFASFLEVDRIEFCSEYSSGGLYPGKGDIEKLVSQTSIPIFVMIRPRKGNFCYSDEEIRRMKEQMNEAADAGASGFVFGALTSERTIDVSSIKVLIRNANGKPCTFHRAFDLTTDLNNSAEILYALGLTRILTSGGKESASKGIDSIRKLAEELKGKIEIMPGGGIRSQNLNDFLAISGINSVHTAAWNATIERMDPGELKQCIALLKKS